MNGQDCSQERLLTSAAPRNKRILAVRSARRKPRVPRVLHEQARKVLDKCGTNHDDSPAGHDKWNFSCGG